jgi:hypothetical protein
LGNKSKLYSKVESVKMKKGENSGNFIIHYDKTAPNKNEINQKLSIALDLSNYSQFVQFDVVLNQIPVGV